MTRNLDLKDILNKVNLALDELYLENKRLFDVDLCERCINHRFAVS